MPGVHAQKAALLEVKSFDLSDAAAVAFFQAARRDRSCVVQRAFKSFETLRCQNALGLASLGSFLAALACSVLQGLQKQAKTSVKDVRSMASWSSMMS